MALKRISLLVQLLDSLQATDPVGDPPEGLRSRFQVEKAFYGAVEILGFFFQQTLLGSCCVRGPQRYGDCFQNARVCFF